MNADLPRSIFVPLRCSSLGRATVYPWPRRTSTLRELAHLVNDRVRDTPNDSHSHIRLNLQLTLRLIGSASSGIFRFVEILGRHLLEESTESLHLVVILLRHGDSGLCDQVFLGTDGRTRPQRKGDPVRGA